MRLATYTLLSDPANVRIGAQLNGHVLDLVAAERAMNDGKTQIPASMKVLLALGEAGMARARAVLEQARKGAMKPDGRMLAAESEIRFLPPVPDADKFLCVGKNYRTHLEELRKNDLIKEMPGEPTGFIKLNSCLTGHSGDVIRRETVNRLDYEPELVFVLGKAARHAKREDAVSYIAGITILNDLTCRDTQKAEVASGSRFWTSKNSPTFGPLGPYIITMDEVPDPYNIWVTCSVNGVQRMRVNTADQIWKLPDIIPHFSRLLDLQPGDMFATGAPGGVAVGKADAESLYLKPGDVVECAFEAPAMVLRNRIVAP
ncbi:MAG: fumarylacetoacetate hydrolase family protein [Betaproteobacteria bacterium]|jgi:2-keto-4-pentenoate hydratase/2-oxohepta-3-ene-1,7-dioic acid hydratase in catechol pathway|nr:fumarylacetoacetate hydrolase family protein [Betaproteobacteria bacterium]